MPKVTWTGDASSAEKAAQKLAAAQEAVNKKFSDGAKGAKALEQAAQQIVKANEGPQERYNRRLAEATAAYKAGKISLDDLRTATQRYRDELDKASRSSSSLFGDKFKGALTGAVAGFASVGGAISALKSAFDDLEKRSQSAADSVFNALGAFGELQQLGPEGFAKGVSIARGLVASGAVSPEDKATAANIASDLINAGFNDKDIKFITEELAATKKVAPGNLVAVGGQLAKLQRNFGESDLESVTGRLLSAAAETQANLAITSREITKFAPLAASVGVNLNESAAAFAVSEQRSASPEAAAENLKSFFSQVFRRGLASGDLQGTLDNIQSKLRGGKTAFDLLGDANAVIGFQQLTGGRSQLDAYEAQFGGAAFDRTDLLSTDPVLRAAQLKAKALGRGAAATEEGRSEQELLLDTLYEEQRQAGERRGEGVLSYLLRATQFSFADTFGGEAGFLRSQSGKTVSGFGGLLNPELGGQIPGASAETNAAILDMLRRIEENTNKSEKTIRSKVATRAAES